MVNIFTFQEQTKSFLFYDSHSFFEPDVESLMNQLLHSISTFYSHDLKIKIGCNKPLPLLLEILFGQAFLDGCKHEQFC